jgi:hypothetical protein
MQSMKLSAVNVIDSTNISATFSSSLASNISTSNVSIISQQADIPSPTVLTVSVSGNTLNIQTQPLTSQAAYLITFQSTPTIPFISLHGDATLFQNGVANTEIILGPIESNNAVKTYLTNYFRNNLYDISDASVIGKDIQALSIILSKALNDIHQSKNENYLSFNVVDEQKTRSNGPSDRLDEEGAYEVLRVGKNPTGAISTLTFNYTNIPTDPISLLQTFNSEYLLVNTNGALGTFNLNNFTLNLSERFLTQLKTVTFIYNNGHAPYSYNVDGYGYQIQNSRYDTSFAFTYLALNDNQIKLNDAILQDVNFSLQNIQQIYVEYNYKYTGRVIDPTTIIAETVLPSGREAVPPLENVFTLKHAPIVKQSGAAGAIGDVIFIDPNQLASLNKPHPAFIYEIPFNFESLPARPGEYSVNYSNGTVYVYGQDSLQTGTGAYPPIATYSYSYLYKDQVDYVYDEDLTDLVALPLGSMINNPANIIFNYENVLAKGIDYIPNVHSEALNERIGNNLLALNAIKSTNSPITNVFRIYNETSGEIYTPIRWNDNKIYFSYNKAPSINNLIGERPTFEVISNEMLFVSTVFTTSNPSISIYKSFLSNNNIIADTEDCIGTIYNSSAHLSNTNIFIQERYFDNFQTEAQNFARLTTLGHYQIDYINGIVYCAVSSTQSMNIGTISYKRSHLITNFPHITSVEDIYYRINLLNPKGKEFTYTTFDNGYVVPSSFDYANERYLNNSSTSPYSVSLNSIGTFINTVFTAGVTSPIKYIRGIYEVMDLQFNTSPINFGPAASFTGSSITTAPLSFSEYHSIQYNVTDGYNVLLNTNLLYQSPNITLTISIIRSSDGYQMWNNSGIVVLGSPIKLILPGINSPKLGDAVTVAYSYTINNLSGVVVDYNKGDYYIDYSYLADEILISYEYGDNVLDFRQSSALSIGDTYYVSYRAGALRDALLKNFGTLIDIPVLNSLNVDFERERYRDALTAALQSFIQGPTLTAIKEIVSKISHTPTQIIESAFQNWSIGNSLLNKESIKTTGAFSLVPAKYNNGVTVDQPNQTISFPVSSNLRLEEGTLEGWVIPEWNGIDNESSLSINIFKDGYVMPANQIFIGAAEYHPTYTVNFPNNTYTLNLDKTQNVQGTPNTNKDGAFIYYDKDSSGTFNRWYIQIIDGYGSGPGKPDGYVDGYYTDGYLARTYQVNVTTNGKFYDFKSNVIPQPSSTKIYSGTNSASFTINTIYNIAQGVTFVADNQHYLFDFGEAANKNRFSIFKDESGYINFRVIDKNKSYYSISSNISSWQAGQQHHVAVAWKLNNQYRRDELHLFIDGQEVPNLIRYGTNISPYLHEKYRTLNPEEIVGIIPKNIVGSSDLTTTFGSNIVTSSINFSAYGINIGDTLFIEEVGFNAAGYTINLVNGQALTLSSTMPLTGSNLRFSANRVAISVNTEIDIYPNISVSLAHSILDGYDGYTLVGSNIFGSNVYNFTTAGIQPGYLIRIDGAQFANNYIINQVNGHQLILNNTMPVNDGYNAIFHIYSNITQEIPGVSAVRPAYEIEEDGYFNAALSLGDLAEDGYFADVLKIRDQALKNDLIFINTLGVNHKRIKTRFYVWGNTTNVIKTYLEPPVSINEVSIKKVLLPFTSVGPQNSVLGGGNFTSIDGYFTIGQSSNSNAGRQISISITGDNIDYSFSPTVTIFAKAVNQNTHSIFSTSETLTFASSGTQNTTNFYVPLGDGYSDGYIRVVCKPLNTTKNCCSVELKELHSITIQDGYSSYAGSSSYPIIRYSYQVRSGNTLASDGVSTVSDVNGFFTSLDVNNYLLIHSPAPSAGYYKINSISSDHKSATVSSINGTLTHFNYSGDGYAGGVYEILNFTTYRSGLQNGFFTFEDGYHGLVGIPFFLTQGLYEFDYYAYLSIPIDYKQYTAYVGSDIFGKNQAFATLDEFKIYSNKLTDIRIGEIAQNNINYITKDFNSLKALKSDSNTLSLLHFDTFPFVDSSDSYIRSSSKFIQSSNSINNNFNQSVYITNNPIIVNNLGILNTKTEGTIEFWVNPLFDAANDPNYRFYFDASGMVSEKISSINSVTAKVAGKISKVLSVKLQVGNNNIDYFAGGTIGSDLQTIHLNQQLPAEQMPIIVNYIPNGVHGDRMSIYKDNTGYINFDINANGTDYQVRAPIYWAAGTWHRLKASYKINKGIGKDELRLFVDGYEMGNILFGNGLLFGQYQVFGSTFVGAGSNIQANLKFQDSINEFTIGSDYSGNNGAFALIDNLRISNISRPLYKPFGESIDINYNPNLNTVFPVLSDLYTTYLLDFDSITTKNTNFATLKNKKTGLFDFSVNVFDSFGIINSNIQVKTVLETLLGVLKPANSQYFITYE